MKKVFGDQARDIITNQKLTNEINRAIAAETTIQGEIDAIISGGSVEDERVRATAAEATINTSLTTEIARATAAEATLNTAVGTTAENLSAESTRATNAESSLANSINSEITRATTAEQSIIDNNISTPFFTVDKQNTSKNWQHGWIQLKLF